MVQGILSLKNSYLIILILLSCEVEILMSNKNLIPLVSRLTPLPSKTKFQKVEIVEWFLSSWYGLSKDKTTNQTDCLGLYLVNLNKEK